MAERTGPTAAVVMAAVPALREYENQQERELRAEALGAAEARAMAHPAVLVPCLPQELRGGITGCF